MSEWKKQVEEKARRVAIEYALEDGRGVSAVHKRSVRNSGTDSDMIFGLFAIFMSIALALIALGFCAVSGGNGSEGLGTAAFYLMLCIVVMASGICNIIRSLR